MPEAYFSNKHFEKHYQNLLHKKNENTKDIVQPNLNTPSTSSGITPDFPRPNLLQGGIGGGPIDGEAAAFLLCFGLLIVVAYGVSTAVDQAVDQMATRSYRARNYSKNDIKQISDQFKSVTNLEGKKKLIANICQRMDEIDKSPIVMFKSPQHSKTSRELKKILCYENQSYTEDKLTEHKWLGLETFWSVLTDEETHATIAGQSRWTGRRTFQIIIDETSKFISENNSKSENTKGI